MDRRREATLDVMRGLAILLVMFFHLRIDTGIAGIDRALLPVVDAGWIGVDLFFVLSGFLVGRLVLQEIATTGTFDRQRFLVRRIVRLWPVLFVYLAAMILAGGAAGWQMAWPVLLHVQNYSRNVPSHLWSLAVEEHFYLAVAWLLPIVAIRYRAGMVALALVALIVGVMAWRMTGWHGGVAIVDLQWQTQYRADAIAIGVALAWIAVHRPVWLMRLSAYRAAWFMVAVLGFAIVAGIDDWRDRFGPGLIVSDIAAAALLVGLHGAVIPSFLATPARALAALGTLAYPLYIWHPSVADATDTLLRSWPVTMPFVATAIRYGLAIGVAWLIAVGIERPFMALRHRRPDVEQTGNQQPSRFIAIEKHY